MSRPIKSLFVRREFAECLGLIDSRLKAFFWLGCATGLRASDLLKLKWCDFILGGQFEPWSFREFAVIVEQKTKKERSVYISGSVKSALSDLSRVCVDFVPSGWLFPSRSSRNDSGHLSLSYINQQMRVVSDKLGLSPFTSHSLRKTFGFLLYSQTKDLSLVQYALNHDSQRQTLIYIGLADEVLHKALDEVIYI